MNDVCPACNEALQLPNFKESIYARHSCLTLHIDCWFGVDKLSMFEITTALIKPGDKVFKINVISPNHGKVFVHGKTGYGWIIVANDIYCPMSYEEAYHKLKKYQKLMSFL